MSDISSIISSAVSEHKESHPESVDAVEPVEAAAVADPEVVEGTEAVEATALVEPADDVTKELEAAGIKPPVEGQRENRIPYSRVEKILANTRKKLTDVHAAELKTRDEQSTQQRGELERLQRLHSVADEDPHRYLEMLAAVNPVYKKFLGGVTAEAAKPAVPTAADDPKPQPEKFEDGSIGYSPERLDKLLEWNARQAKREAIAEVSAQYEQRFGPIEKEWKTNQDIQQRLPGVRSQIESARKTWGTLFEDEYKKGNESEIIKAMQLEPNTSFDAIVARVLLPKLQLDRNKMRAEILKEQNGRAAAATRTTPVAATAAATSDTPRTTADVIRESLAALR